MKKIILINLILVFNLFAPIYAGAFDDDIDWVKKYYIEDGLQYLEIVFR